MAGRRRRAGGAARQVDPRDFRRGGRGRFPRQGVGGAGGVVRPAGLRRVHRRRRGGARGQPGAVAGVGARRLADGRRRNAVAAACRRRPHRRTPAGADGRRPGGGRGSVARPRAVVSGVRPSDGSDGGPAAGGRRRRDRRRCLALFESANALCVGRVRVPDRRGRRQLPQRLRRPTALREKHPLARLALRPLFPADPRPRQPSPARLLAAGRPLPVLRPDVLGQLLFRRAVHRLRLRRPLLSGNHSRTCSICRSCANGRPTSNGVCCRGRHGRYSAFTRPCSASSSRVAVRFPVHGSAVERHGLRHDRRPDRGDAVRLAVPGGGGADPAAARPDGGCWRRRRPFPDSTRGRSGRRNSCRRGCRPAVGNSAWRRGWPGRWPAW